MKNLIKYTCLMTMLLCISQESSGADRPEVRSYSIPFRAATGADPISINATLTVKVSDVNKRLSELTSDDPDYLIKVKDIVQKIIDKDATALAGKLLSRDLNSASRITERYSDRYQSFGLNGIKITRVLFADHYYIILCNGEWMGAKVPLVFMLYRDDLKLYWDNGVKRSSQIGLHKGP